MSYNIGVISYNNNHQKQNPMISQEGPTLSEQGHYPSLWGRAANSD